MEFKAVKGLVLVGAVLLIGVKESVPTHVLVGVAAGAGIAATIEKLSEEGHNRNIVIELTNMLNVSIIGGDVYTAYGTTRIPPPTVIQPNSRELFQFQKYSDTAQGTTAIVSYTINDEINPIKLAIIESVPFNYFHSRNWFGLEFINHESKPDVWLYYDMYKSPAWDKAFPEVCFRYAYTGKPAVIHNSNYLVSATMSNLGRAVMRVGIHYNNGQKNTQQYIGK